MQHDTIPSAPYHAQAASSVGEGIMTTSFSDFGERFTGRSGIHELMVDLGLALASGSGIVMMGGGAPAHIPGVDNALCAELREIAADSTAAAAVLGDYEAPLGSAAFRSAAAAWFQKTAGFDIGPEHIALTSGSQPAFFTLFNLFGGSCAGSSSRKIVLPLAPEYIGYSEHGIEPDFFLAHRALIDCPAPRRFKYRIDFPVVEASLGRAAALCVSRPTNPSGNMISDAELVRLQDLVEAEEKWLIVDNAYGLPFPNAVFVDATPRWTPRTILTYSFSKLGMPGTRTGLVVAHPDIIRRFEVANSVLFLSNGNLGMKIATRLFESDAMTRLANDMVRPFYREQSRRALAVLDSVMPRNLDWRVHESEGAFFLWLWIPGLKGGDSALYTRLKEQGVLVIPGHWFFYGLSEPWTHRSECVRISFCIPPDRLEEGLTTLARTIEQTMA